jgi:cytochrome bd-type quinol oxidase subunit 1
MNAPKRAEQSERAAISAEALVGLGITIAALGLLGLLLGWAQHMRSVPESALLWLALGAGCVVLGVIIAGAARARKGRQPRSPQ